MAYKRGNRDQAILFPESIDLYVQDDDPVRVYDAFIDALNLADLGLYLDDNQVGNSAYDPVGMLKILVYGYSYGWRSSRKLERALHHNLSFIWIAGGLKPDYKTIANFRKNHIELLKKLLKQCAQLCLKLNLIEGSTLFVDGSKIRGNASKDQTKSQTSWEACKKEVEQRIEALLEESSLIDDKEDGSLVRIDKELSSKRKLASKIEEVLSEIKEGKSINATDPDVQIMKGRQGSHASYNAQIVTDDKNGLIVSTDISTSKNDLNELGKQLNNAEANLNASATVICADAGYSSMNDLDPLIEQGKTVIVPTSSQIAKQRGRKTQDSLYSPETFYYDSSSDTYTCPQGNKLHRSAYSHKRKRTEYRFRSKDTCLSCSHFGKCTSSKIGRRIYRKDNLPNKEKLESIYDSQYGQKIYKRRKMIAEIPFGHIKRNLSVSSFLLRRIEGVNAELSLLGTCFNISRIITLLGGAKQAAKVLRGG